MTLKQWLGAAGMLFGGVALFVIKLLSGIYPCLFDSISGFCGFVRTFDLVWLVVLAVGSVTAGICLLFSPQLRKIFPRAE